MNSIRVLLIEDDEDDAWLTEQMLRGVTSVNYEVDWVRSVSRAREAIGSKSFDVALVDHYLNDASGLEFIEEFVSSVHGFPVILLTGKSDAGADEAALNAGAADYLSKTEINGMQLDRSIRYSIKQGRILAQLQESREFHKLILDSLTSEIAILDELGNIINVNAAWTRFSGPENKPCGVGANYLDVCRNSASMGDGIAQKTLRAIEDVRDRRWTAFSLEYPCDIPGRRMWFLLQISAFADNGLPRITVEHTDITEHRMTLEAALRLQKRLRALLAAGNLMQLVIDAQGRIIDATPATAEFIGMPADAMMGKSFFDLLHSDDRGLTALALSAGDDHWQSRELVRFHRPDGKPRRALISCNSPEPGADPPCSILTLNPESDRGNSAN